MRPLELSADLLPPRSRGPEIALVPEPVAAPPLLSPAPPQTASASVNSTLGTNSSALASIVAHLAFIFALNLWHNVAKPPETDDFASAIAVELVSLAAEATPDPTTTASTASNAMVSAGDPVPQPVETPELPVDKPVTSKALPDLPAPIEIAEVSAPSPVISSDLPPVLTAPEPAEDAGPAQPAPVEAPKPLPQVEAPKPQPQPMKEAPKTEQPRAETPKVATLKPEKPKPQQKQKPKPASGNGGKSDADTAAASGGKPQKTASASGSGSAEVAKYPGLVQRKLRRALRFPKGAGSAKGEVQVRFVIAASGSVSGIKVVASSGHPLLDQEAIATVRRAAPFPAIPADAGRSSWTFTMPLAFVR